jgi:hypothetical protein
MNDKEKDFKKRLEKEQEDLAYKEWKKKNDPAEIEKKSKKIEPFNPSKNAGSWFTYAAMFTVFQLWFWLYWNKR